MRLKVAHTHRCQICQTTGWGGQPVRAHGTNPGDGTDISSRVIPVTSANRIRVTFSSSISDTLPWKFTPQQREVRVLPGETALAFYTATNKSDKDIIGVATYSVTPAQCAPYFSKIQCFCFEEQRLNAGETVDMPVFFYLDPDLLNDLNMKGVETVTLNYTFFSKWPDTSTGMEKLIPGRGTLRQQREVQGTFLGLIRTPTTSHVKYIRHTSLSRHYKHAKSAAKRFMNRTQYY